MHHPPSYTEFEKIEKLKFLFCCVPFCAFVDLEPGADAPSADNTFLWMSLINTLCIQSRLFLLSIEVGT
jgi:hypothetical protein